MKFLCCIIYKYFNKLINELDDDHYVVRRRAQYELSNPIFSMLLVKISTDDLSVEQRAEINDLIGNRVFSCCSVVMPIFNYYTDRIYEDIVKPILKVGRTLSFR